MSCGRLYSRVQRRLSKKLFKFGQKRLPSWSGECILRVIPLFFMFRGSRMTIQIRQTSGNVARVSVTTASESTALDRLLTRKVKDPVSGLMEPATVVWDKESKGSGYIPVGLVPWIISKLRNRYNIEDLTYIPDDTYIKLDAEHFSPMEPRDYQINAGRKLLATHRGILQGITGSGKSTIMGAMIKAVLKDTDWNVILIGFTTDHWVQVQESLRSMGVSSQEVGDGSPSCRVTIGRFSKFDSHLGTGDVWDRRIRSCEVVLIDEVHHLGSAATYINLARSMNPLRIYGFDATPFRSAKDSEGTSTVEDLGTLGYCGPVIEKIDYKYLQVRGYLPLTYVRFIPMPRPPKELSSQLPRNIHLETDFETVYKKLIVENDWRTSRFASLITTLAGGGKVLVLIKQHDHAKRLMHMLESAGVESLAWFGSGQTLAISSFKGVYTPRFGHEEVRRRFMEGDLPVVIGSSVLSEAISLDAATDAVNMAAGKVLTLSVQRAGRVMRRNNGLTPVVTYWDSYDSSNRVLQLQSQERKKQYEQFGLDTFEMNSFASICNLRSLCITTGYAS